MIEPDALTKDRLQNLSAVGKALNDTYSEENLDSGTDFITALDSLNRFKEGLDQLVLEEPVRKIYRIKAHEIPQKDRTAHGICRQTIKLNFIDFFF